MSGEGDKAVGRSLLRVVCVRAGDGYQLAYTTNGAPPVIATDETGRTAARTTRLRPGSTAATDPTELAGSRPGLNKDEGRRRTKAGEGRASESVPQLACPAQSLSD